MGFLDDVVSRLTGRLGTYLAGALLLVSLAGALWLAFGWRDAESRVKAQTALTAAAEKAHDVCRTDLANANAAVERQNDATLAWKAEAERMQREAAEAAQRAEKAAGVHLRRADRIAAVKPSGDLCVAARNLIVSNLSEDRQ